MNTRTITGLALLTSAVLLGCEQAREPAPPVVPVTAANPALTVPAKDPSLPSAEAASKTPKTGSDATPDTALTQKERDQAMPLPGQANDHSNPEFAKKGEDKSPVKMTY